MKKTTHLLKLFSFSAFLVLLLAWVIFAKLPVQATTQNNFLVNSSKLDNVSAALGQSATGTIAGTVTDMAGKPIANHLVRLYTFVDDPMGGSGWQTVQSVSTDASGIYTFTGNVYLDVGYKVEIYNSFGSSSAPYMTEFFDNVGTLDAANLLTPTTGAPLVIANAQLTQGIIKGRVLDEQGHVIPNISISAESGSMVYIATVDDTGAYTITGIAAGVYKVCGSASGFVNGCYGSMFDTSKATTVTVSLQTPVFENINFSLSTGAQITGRVTTEAGEPLKQTYVSAYSYRSDGFSPPAWLQTGSFAYSDPQGYYTMTAILSGTYRLHFQPNTYPVQYLSEYYNDASAIDAAQDIVLTSTQRVSNINAQLALGGMITGRVTDKSGNPVSGLMVRPYQKLSVPFGEPYWGFVRGESGANLVFYVDSSGYYTVSGLLSDTYRLSVDGGNVMPEFYKDSATVNAATDITVTVGQTVPNINFQVGQLGKIQGRVTDKQGNPIDKISVRANQWLPDISGGVWNTLSFEAMTDSSGMYTITNLPAGQFRIRFLELEYGTPFRGFESEYYNDSLTAEGALSITVNADDVIQGIDAQLGRLGGISGVLQDWKGNPLPNTMIYPFKYSDCCGWTAIWYGMPTDDHGRFSLSTLDSNKYIFQYSGDDFHPNQYYNGALAIDAVTPITVTSDTTTTVTFRLAPYGSISGTVTSLTGSAIPSATVTLWRNIDWGGGNYFPENMGSTQTDSQGKYAFGPLSGKTVSLPATNSTVFYVEFADTRQPAQYISEFFNNATGLNSATPVTVTVNTVTQVNAQLASVVVANQPPVAQNDAISLARGATISRLTGGATSLLANDVDAENAPLTATVVTNPVNGALTLNANGTFTYTHNNSKTTSDLFTYRASDGVNQSNIATVTITIKPLVSFEFSKTVSILGIEPACGAIGTMKVPVTTTINYCYSITNNGDVTLTTHSLVDDKLGTLLNNAAVTLAPGATHRVQFSQTLTVNTTNIATWTATSNVAGLTAAELDAADVALGVKQATITISAPTDDQDGDTIPDNLESAGDADGDNLPNFLDTDANGNGTPDASEVGANPLAPVDSNGNGVPDYLDLVSTLKVYLPVISR